MATPMKAAHSVTLKFLQRINAFPSLTSRCFGTSIIKHIKKIEVTKTDSATVIEGVKLKEEKSHKVREIKAPTGCPLCEFQDSLTYRDVLILQQFLSPDGKILPQHVTGVCYTMQWKLKNILYQSYSAGLLPNYRPELPVNEDSTHYLKNYKWRKNNVYYEDFSIENPL
ncbi:28S ribosomal protein S18a, mitochondrial-like [Elysia marginata]|uniref:28S ribosomal protein S18a, mitochondrial-like n=1 Tax=Elysia marginata TaxID=1093978 RepID=A0AAV4ENX8_9GAST|nr:28S ribosomal protein S18a, mitochondrial-like [Elysia marginata]